MPVPNSFANVTTSIPLSQLDANFNTPITLGNTAIQLGNTVTTLNNMTLANVTISSGNTTVTSETISGNLTFTGTGNRITGDFSNATVANRVLFQTSTVNGQTSVEFIPNGTSTASQLIAGTSSSDTANASFALLRAGLDVSEVRLASERRGTGTYLPMTFYTGGFEAMRIATSGNVGIGTSSPNFNSASGTVCHINNNTASAWAVSHYTNGSTGSGAADGVIVGNIGSEAYVFNYESASIIFGTSATERARITSGGDLLVGKTAANVGVDGCEVGTNYLAVSRPAAPPLIVNRNTDDGALVSFRQATVEEGTISVSGTTVSYNGGHLARWSQLLSGQRDESIVKGTVLSNLDEMCEWLDSEGNPLPNEQLNRTKVSDVEGDTNVAGVFVNWDNDDQDNPYDMNIAMTGDMIIRIAQGVTVQKGDLLMSAGDGTAKPQGDDIVRSKTVAKVTSNHVTCTYDDGSYCVPCVLMAC